MKIFWRGKTLANRSFHTFGEENVGELTIANNIISYFSESGIWLGKILANDVQFAKFTKVFPRQNFALYGIWLAYLCGVCLVRHVYLMGKHALMTSLFMWCMTGAPCVFNGNCVLVTS